MKKQKKEEIMTETEFVEPIVLQGAETKLALARRVIRHLKLQIENLERFMESASASEDVEVMLKQQGDEMDALLGPALGERSIEGVFDGEQMIGEDGQKYAVPPNYASKSKLVEGDLLRLTINHQGRFLFKQKGPIDRQRMMGTLVQDENTQDWLVVADGRKFHVLGAAISFHKGESNDQAVILVPKSSPSKWAAVENVIKKGMEEGEW